MQKDIYLLDKKRNVWRFFFYLIVVRCMFLGPIIKLLPCDSDLAKFFEKKYFFLKKFQICFRKNILLFFLKVFFLTFFPKPLFFTTLNIFLDFFYFHSGRKFTKKKTGKKQENKYEFVKNLVLGKVEKKSTISLWKKIHLEFFLKKHFWA